MALTSEQELALLALLDNYTNNKKTISDLESAVEAEADQLLPIEKAGATKNISVDDIRAFVEENFSLFATTSTSGTSLLRSPITIANNVSDANNDIDFSAGTFQFDDGSGQAAAIAMTKRLDAAWAAGTNQGGLDTGTVANNTPYYIYAIHNPTTLAADILYTATKGSPTLPSGFTKKAYIGACHTDGSANIRNGKWKYDSKGSIYHFIYDTPVKDIDETVPATTVQTKTISAPAGSFPIMPVYYTSTVTGGGIRYLIFTEVGSTDLTPSSSIFDMIINQGTSEIENDSSLIDYIQLSSSSQLRYRSNTTASTIINNTRGWKEYL